MEINQKYVLVFLVVGVIILSLFLFSGTNFTKKNDFDLQIDALKEEQSLFTHTRVMITNTGLKPLTNIIANYGNISEEIIPILEPGQSYPLSPPPESNLEKIILTTNEGINITKEYRSPIKVPGMMGS